MRQSSTKGFKHGASILTSRIRRASESRGFAISRILTHWSDIAGESLGGSTRPVKISHTRQSFGATLTVLAAGPQAPLVEMQKERLRERVNSVYGYNAISRIVITQTAPEGFAEGQVQFDHQNERLEKPLPSPGDVKRAQHLTGSVDNPDLKSALETLGSHVLSRSSNRNSKAEK